MPLFEYRCSACGRLEEVLQKHSDPAPDECPQCHAHNTMGKELSLSAFHLKGGGWYKDLYASSSASTAAPPEASSTKTETKSDSTKTESTKTESAKTETKAATPAASSSSSGTGSAAA